MNCPNCGKEVPNQDAIFCPYCAKPIRMAQKRTGFPTASGVLTIIGSCIAILYGILGLIDASLNYYNSGPYAIVGIFGILAFAFGLTGGILTLRRKVFVLAIIGISLVLISGIIISVAIPIGFIFGIPVMILSILGLIFTSISKREFT